MRFIQFILLFFCLIGASHAKAEHISNNPILPSSTSSVMWTNISDEACSLSVSNDVSISCELGSSSVPSTEWASLFDLSHDIYVNSFTLRLAHATLNNEALTPDYVKVFEFTEISWSSMAFHQHETLAPQSDWMIKYDPQSSRLSGWKDSNLQYIPQQYSHA
ncbi:hypothetical protein [Vibrio aphrogenes]|uniref:hypothetical protein n=1 Tax=Vibrio aphrogenes TaxID=1891186 RepID=UPI000F7F9E00|nr:hypothetical protein [Vibrio aphrogenes]